MDETNIICGGVVDKLHVRAIIRHSVFTGSARLLYEGHDEARKGDIYLPLAPDNFRERMAEAIDKASRFMAMANPRAALLGREINLVSIYPLPASLAKRAHEVFTMLEPESFHWRNLPKEREGWEKFFKGLVAEGAELDWDAFGVVHRIYEKEWRASYEGGNEPVRQGARQNLHKILRALLDHPGYPDSGFALKALPAAVSICTTLLDVLEKQQMNDHLRNIALGMQLPPITFGRFKFVTEGGYIPKMVEVLDNHVYPYIRQKWLAIKDRPSQPPAADRPEQPPMYLFENRDNTGITGWLAVKSSKHRQIIYVAPGLAQALAENPLALAELLIYEISAHLDEERPIVSREYEERHGEGLRRKLVELCKPFAPEHRTLADLFPKRMSLESSPVAPQSSPTEAPEKIPPPQPADAKAGQAKLSFWCPQCGKTGRVSVRYAGRRLRCSKCGKISVGLKISGGEIDEHYVRATIRHSVFAGSARLLYEGNEWSNEIRWGDIYLPKASDSMRDRMRDAFSEAATYIRKVDVDVAFAVKEVKIVAVNPLPAKLAKRAHEVFYLLDHSTEGMAPWQMEDWRKFVKGLLVEGADLEWDTLSVVHRTYGKEWRASYKEEAGREGRNKVRQRARRSLHKILSSLLAELREPNSVFALKCMPVIASICTTLLDDLETARMNDHVQNSARGAESPAIDFATFNFVAEGGYGCGEIDIFNKQAYPLIYHNWAILKDGLPDPLVARDAGPPPMYLFELRDDTGIIAWQVAKGSRWRQTIYVAAGLGEALAENPVALAEVLIYWVRDDFDPDKGHMSWVDKHADGEQSRQKLLEVCAPLNPGLRTLSDLLPAPRSGGMAPGSPPQQPASEPDASRASSDEGEARLRLVCPQCGKPGRVRAEHAGRSVKCSKCGKIIVVPGRPA